MDNRMNYCPMMQMYGNQMPCNMQSPANNMPNAQMPMMQMPANNMPNAQMPMMQMPANNMPNAQMPMMNMPMMNMPNAQMPMMEMEDEELEMDMMEMYPDNCKKMMPYVTKEIEKMEKKDEMLYDKYMDKNMVEQITDKVYDEMKKEMPEMVEESEALAVSNIAQYGRRRNTGRDLIQILLLNELFRRGRGRGRRRRNDYYNYPPYYNPYSPFNY